MSDLKEGVYFTKPGLCPKCAGRLKAYLPSRDVGNISIDGEFEYEFSETLKDENGFSNAICVCMQCGNMFFSVFDMHGMKIPSDEDHYIYPHNEPIPLHERAIKEKTFNGNPFAEELVD